MNSSLVSKALWVAALVALTGSAAAADPSSSTTSTADTVGKTKVVGDAPQAEPAAKPKAKHAPARKTSYEQCVKENMADAEYYCQKHPEGCQAEKDGVAKQCKDEARGVRFTG